MSECNILSHLSLSSDIPSSTLSSLWIRLSTEVFIWPIELFNSKICLVLFQNLFISHSYPALSFFFLITQLFIYILLEFAELLKNHSFEYFTWNFIHFDIFGICYYRIINIRRIRFPSFFIFLVFLHWGLHINWDGSLFHFYVRAFLETSLLLIIFLGIGLLYRWSLNSIRLFGIISLWLLWLWLMDSDTMSTVSEPEEPTFYVHLTKVGPL